MLFFRAQSTKAYISHANSPCHGIYGFLDWKKIYIEQLLPLSSLLFVSSALQQNTIWKPVIQTECSHCFAPNDLYFLFYQQCGTPCKRDNPVNRDSPIDSKPLATHWDALENHLTSSKYRRKCSALGNGIYLFSGKVIPS